MKGGWHDAECLAPILGFSVSPANSALHHAQSTSYRAELSVGRVWREQPVVALSWARLSPIEDS